MREITDRANRLPFKPVQVCQRKKQIFGALICESRRNLKMTQEDVAKKMNCSISTICFIEGGRCQDYRVLFLQELATLLQIDPIMTVWFLYMPINPSWSDEQILNSYLNILKHVCGDMDF